MTTQPGYDPADYYVWRTPSGFSIHLSLHVVRELSAQIAASGDVRGVLLGRSITAPFAGTMVNDFVLVSPSEDFERAPRFIEGAGHDHAVIGFFQSQRDGGLSLGAREIQTFERLFGEEGNIALSIRAPRRGDTEAALFYWQSGGIQPDEFGFGFPFDATKLGARHPGWRFPDPLERHSEAPQRAAFQRSREVPMVTPRESIRWSRLLPTVVLVTAGIGATQLVWNSRATTSANSPQITAEATTPIVAPVYETPLGLKVTAQPHQLEIRWNRAAPVVASAAKGSMSITESGVTESVPFEAQELRDGYVAYTPKTNDVSVRLEVTGAGGRPVTESIRVVAIP